MIRKVTVEFYLDVANDSFEAPMEAVTRVNAMLGTMLDAKPADWESGRCQHVVIPGYGGFENNRAAVIEGRDGTPTGTLSP